MFSPSLDSKTIAKSLFFVRGASSTVLEAENVQPTGTQQLTRANPNISDSNGVTPLMLAIDTLQPQVIINLICSGADPNQEDNSGKSAWDRVKSLSFAKLVIDKVYDINRSDPNGVTALMRAADNLDTGFIAFLRRREANPDMQDKDGKTALHYAIDKHSLRAVDALTCDVSNLIPEN